MLGEKGCCPPVQLLRPDHHAECGTLGELYLPEIVIDAAERIFGSLVVQKRVLRATIERFEIQRHQKGFLHLGEMNLFGLHQIPPCERSRDEGPWARNSRCPTAHAVLKRNVGKRSERFLLCPSPHS